MIYLTYIVCVVRLVVVVVVPDCKYLQHDVRAVRFNLNRLGNDAPRVAGGCSARTIESANARVLTPQVLNNDHAHMIRGTQSGDGDGDGDIAITPVRDSR